MIVFSPIIIVLVILMTIGTLLYLPIDYSIYRRYRSLGEYKIFFSIKRREEIKELKIEKNQV